MKTETFQGFNSDPEPEPMFKDITKGEWKFEYSQIGVNNPDGLFGETIAAVGYRNTLDGDNAWIDFNNSEENGKLIAFAGNLAQQYNLEYIEEAVQTIERFYREHLSLVTMEREFVGVLLNRIKIKQIK